MPAILAARMISSPHWWAHRVRKAHKVRLVLLVHKALKVNKARKVKPAPLARKDRRASKVLQVWAFRKRLPSMALH